MPMGPLYPPVITTLPAATASTAAATAYATTADAYGITPETFWLGQIADLIITAANSGVRYVYVENYKVTTTNTTALTGAGYTVTNPAAAPISNQAKISWT